MSIRNLSKWNQCNGWVIGRLSIHLPANCTQFARFCIGTHCTLNQSFSCIHSKHSISDKHTNLFYKKTSEKVTSNGQGGWIMWCWCFYVNRKKKHLQSDYRRLWTSIVSLCKWSSFKNTEYIFFWGGRNCLLVDPESHTYAVFEKKKEEKNLRNIVLF